ncbi:MAG TPA: ion channel [Terriglobales bacterium]
MLVLLNMDQPAIPVEVPIEVLGFGSVMLVIIVLIHGAGLDRIIDRYKRRSEVLRRKSWHPQLAMTIFATSILLMLFLHVFEICVWGLVLKNTGLIPNIRDSMYFSANTYTTIGYGQMVLPYNWRELSPLMAISGLFTFAWTTGEMFNIVDSHHQLVEDLGALRNKKRAELKQVVVQASERRRALETQEKQAGSGMTLEERRALREEIETKLKQLHDAEWAEIEMVRRDES